MLKYQQTNVINLENSQKEIKRIKDTNFKGEIDFRKISANTKENGFQCQMFLIPTD